MNDDTMRSMFWNAVIGIITLGALAACTYAFTVVYRPDYGAGEVMRMAVLFFGMPIILMLSAFEKISKETTGVILTALISFSIGQAIGH